ncbi:glycosyltransferase family 2 protein [Altericista sp. CCNU0014]|uniref:glycosyltransferase family 2 protein n=1 Tax=Altericista sp. CCNU0014 TaxID=3082949 RepID=UPI00384FB76F
MMIDSAISLIIPVHNGGQNFSLCLCSLEQFAPLSTEIIIVVDGGTDESEALARAFAQGSGAKVFVSVTASGPAHARNLGAKIAKGDILFFMDADVVLQADTLEQVMQIFQGRPDIAALIGSYDDEPGATNFLSQYKNLFHHYTHQTASGVASTFWGACGAIRRTIFLEMNGFDESYRYPSVEDIELGYRLKKAGHQLLLCKTIQVKHLKEWRSRSLLKAEIFYRAIPWTELLWRDRQFVNDLNLKVSTRASVLLTYLLVFAIAMSGWWSPSLLVTAVLSLILLAINRSVYRFFWSKRGLWFACWTVPWHWLYFFYSGLSFVIGTLRYRIFGKPRAAKSISRLHASESTFQSAAKF